MYFLEKNFGIIRQNVEGYSAVVLAVSCHAPHEHLEPLTVRMMDLGIQGPVVFDLLLCNGSLNHRFFETEFDGKALSVLKKFKKIEAKEGLEVASAHFFKAHAKGVDFSLLPASLRKEAKKGKILSANQGQTLVMERRLP